MYYSETAFDSSNPVAQKPATKKLSFAQESAKTHALKGRGLHCQEYCAMQDMDMLDYLNSDDPGSINDKNYPSEYYLVWRGLKNPRVKVEVVTKLSLIFAIISGISAPILGLIGDFGDGWRGAVLLTFVFPLILYKLGKTALRKNWIKDKNNTVFNRRTGMVSFSWLGKKVSYPFAEFDPAMQTVVDRTGMLYYHLILMHRYTGQFTREPGSQFDVWKVELYWEELQRFMDISQPLQDTPDLEFYRVHDPVTKAWDEKHHRPKHYWKDMPREKADTIKERAALHAKQFPFGSSRDDAIILGWQTSGVGEGDWREPQHDTVA